MVSPNRSKNQTLSPEARIKLTGEGRMGKSRPVAPPDGVQSDGNDPAREPNAPQRGRLPGLEVGCAYAVVKVRIRSPARARPGGQFVSAIAMYR